jgi:hypothetical protein
VVEVSIDAGYLTGFSGSSSTSSVHSHKNTTAGNSNIQPPNNPGSTNPGAANQPMLSGNQTAAATAANATANGVLIGNTTQAGNDTSGGHQTLFGSHITGMTNRLGNMTSSMEASFNKYLLQAKGNSSSNSSIPAADNSSMAALPASAAPAAPVTPGPATSPPMLQF